MKACKGCSGSKELNHKDCYFHNDGYCTFGEKQRCNEEWDVIMAKKRRRKKTIRWRW